MYHISFLTVRDVMFRLQIRVVSGSILETEGSLVPRAATIEWRLGGGACGHGLYPILFNITLECCSVTWDSGNVPVGQFDSIFNLFEK